MAEVQATPVNQLPANDLPSNDRQDNEIVNEILNEIDNQNMNNNSNMFQRQVDNEVNNTKGSLSEPTPEQIMAMNQQMASNTQIEEQLPPPIQHQMTQQVPMETPKVGNSSESFNILNYIKDTLIVVALVFIFSLPVFNVILGKIPKAMSNGSPSLIGNLIKALLAGAIFFVLNKFV